MSGITLRFSVKKLVRYIQGSSEQNTVHELEEFSERGGGHEE